MALHQFPEREVQIAAKMGFLTKELWQELILPEASRRWTDMAWAQLYKRGYLIPHRNRRLRNVYVINRKNRALMARLGSIASRPPFESQFRHDEQLLAGIIRAERSGMVGHWTSESELKLSEHSSFRISSQGKTLKYPDAILYLNPREEKRVVAVELELTLKDRKRYGQILSAYSFMTGLSLILYVVESPAIENAIRAMAKTHYFPANHTAIGFMSLDDWKRDPVKAAIEVRGSKTSLAEFEPL